MHRMAIHGGGGVYSVGRGIEADQASLVRRILTQYWWDCLGGGKGGPHAVISLSNWRVLRMKNTNSDDRGWKFTRGLLLSCRTLASNPSSISSVPDQPHKNMRVYDSHPIGSLLVSSTLLFVFLICATSFF